jgi:hypothetical protein
MFTERLLALVVVACSVGSLAYLDAVAAPSAADGAGRLLAVYSIVAAELPATGRIGFVSRIADRAAAGAAASTALNAFAPRVLDSDLSAVSFVISTPSAPRELDDDPLLTDFELIRTSAGGIRIYRRRK